MKEKGVKMKNKKRIAVSAALFAALAVLAALYFILKNAESKETEDGGTETENNGTIQVTDLDIDNITSLSYEIRETDDLNDSDDSDDSNKTGKTSFSFVKNSGGQWELKDDKVFPLNDSALTNIAAAVSTLSATRTVGGELSEYGLDEPFLTVYAKYSDGTSLSLSAGDTNSYGTYVLDMTNNTVYLVDSSFKSSFKSSLNDFLKADKMPSVDTDFLTSLTVKDSDGKSGAVTDSEGLKEAAELFLSLDFPLENCAYTDSDGLSSFGITESSPSVTLNYKEATSVTNDDGTQSTVRSDASFELVFGNKFTLPDDGSGERLAYYYTTPGSVVLYAADEETYNKLMGYVNYTPKDTEGGNTSDGSDSAAP